MSTVTIRPVRTSADEMKFIKFLWKIYKDDPQWVPPLVMDRKKLIDKKKNPFYRHSAMELFLAERDGEVVGRIGAIVNDNHNKEHEDKVGFFGFYESVNDQEVADVLFNAAKEFLRAKGMTQMRGPADPSVNDEYGLLVDAFDKSPVVLMTYNPPYYAPLFENYGLKKLKDLYAYLLSQDTVYSERLMRFNEVVKQREGLTFRSLNMKDFKGEVDRIKQIYNSAWSHNWGAVPMTDAEFDALAKDLKPIVVPELVIMAEAKGRPIGFALSLPDINIALKYNKNGGLLTGLWHLYTKKKEINLVRIIVLGVVPEHQRSGAAGVLFYETAARAKKLGYQYGEASWVLEDNVMMNRAAEMMNATRYKTYRLYEMNI
ncbi:MAG: GNAT family N-acetyltransferase [Bacteroidota bacterium]|nr:GNAT family N-acetyltransferase [Bacteroidota bacterium]